MTPNTDHHVWPPASPTQLASALLASLQHLTSSARLFLTGCFQNVGCWRRHEEQDGAWFDCDKLQVEHPYCYVNPLAVSETTTAAASSSSSQPTAAPEPQPDTPCRPSPQRSPGSALPLRGLGMQPTDTLPKRLRKPNANGGVLKTESQRNDKTEEDAGLGDNTSLGDGLARYKGGRAPFVKSFAAKLKADLRRIDHDCQRAEGKVLEAASIPDEEDSIPEASSEDCIDPIFLPGVPSTFPYDETKDSTRLQADVWKSSELEDVFECYNMAAFYSYGASFPAAEKFASKTRGEKFEEVFPVSPHINNNNNNSIKLYKEAVPEKDEGVIENEKPPCENEEERVVSEDEIRRFINGCVVAENLSQVDAKCLIRKCDNAGQSDIINYGGRSFNKSLIFNLVKSTMSECATEYSRSLSVCADYPVHLVERKVMKVLAEEDRNEDNLCGLEMFHNTVMQRKTERQSARRLVQRVATGEMKAEDKQWHDFGTEEREIKETIFGDVLSDLISDTASVLKDLVAKKVSVNK